MHRHAGKTVRDILQEKVGSIKEAPLDEGSPSWAEIMHLTWEEVEERARRRQPGYKTFKKLLGAKEFDK